MRRGKQKVRLSSSVTEIDKKNKVTVVRMTKRKNAGRRSAVMEKDPLALPKRKSKPVPTKAARKQPAKPEEYEVEKIVGHQYLGGKTSYCIRWKGWGPRHDTWEFESDLNCDTILNKYMSSINSTIGIAPAAPKKRGRPAASSASPKKGKKGAVATGRVAKGKVAAKGRGRPPKNSTATKSPAKKAVRKKRAPKEWEVEEIVAVRTTESGQEEFYVKWKGYSSDENTWEPAENVGNCDAAIERFRQSQGDDVPTNGVGASSDEDVEQAAGDQQEDEDDQTTKDTTGDDTQDDSVHD